MLTCTVCGKECNNPMGLGSHMRVHGVAGKSKSVLATRRQQHGNASSKHRITQSSELSQEAQNHISFLFGGFYRDIRNYADACPVPWPTLASGVAELLQAKASGALLGPVNSVPQMRRAPTKGGYRRAAVEVVDRASGGAQGSEAREAGASKTVRLLNASPENRPPIITPPPAITPASFGILLRAARQAMGLTLKQAMKKTRVSGLPKYERGVTRPRARSISRLTRFYHLTEEVRLNNQPSG